MSDRLISDGARFKHTVPLPEDIGHEHPLPWLQLPNLRIDRRVSRLRGMDTVLRFQESGLSSCAVARPLAYLFQRHWVKTVLGEVSWRHQMLFAKGTSNGY